jgi:hypothetical protein
MTTGVPDVVSVVRELSDAAVLFVVVGEPEPGRPLRLVVSRHPTNLDALGRALDRLEATMRPFSSHLEEQATVPGQGPRRLGRETGTISVSTSAGDVDLVFGGVRRSLYADILPHTRERELDGVRVRWANELPARAPSPKVTSRMLSRRLLGLAEELARRLERRGETSGRESPRDA